jgi:predicted dehydrogenase
MMSEIDLPIRETHAPETPLPRRLSVALVGCGAMGEMLHLRALANRSDCTVTALVDVNESRLRELARRYDVPAIHADCRQLVDSGVDAAVLALPNHLHAEASVALLREGIHVLVEKPMAPTVAECDAMIKAADAGGAILAVGLMRRFGYASRFARWAIGTGALGNIRTFSVRNGFVHRWPVTTDCILRRERAGGVLLDFGSHVLDQVLWWFGDVADFDYFDDARGGVEADCRIDLRMQSGVTGTVELSWLRDLSDTLVVEGERGRLEVALVANTVRLRLTGSDMELTGQVAANGDAPVEQKPRDLVAAEIEDFFAAIHTGRSPAVDGVEGKRSIALIEACRERQRPLLVPWERWPQPFAAEARL